jgi:hypothetical protein
LFGGAETVCMGAHDAAYAARLRSGDFDAGKRDDADEHKSSTKKRSL